MHFREMTVKAPSVTSVLEIMSKGEGFLKWVGYRGYEVTRKIADDAGLRGTKVHTAMASWIDSGVEVEGLADDEKKMLDAGRAFLESIGHTHGKKGAKSEYIVHSRDGFNGQVDFFDGGELLVDWKTSKEFREEFDIQTAAYMVAHNEQWPHKPALRRATVRLQADGEFKVKEYPRSADIPAYLAFLGLLKAFNWSHYN